MCWFGEVIVAPRNKLRSTYILWYCAMRICRCVWFIWFCGHASTKMSVAGQSLLQQVYTSYVHKLRELDFIYIALNYHTSSWQTSSLHCNPSSRLQTRTWVFVGLMLSSCSSACACCSVACSVAFMPSTRASHMLLDCSSSRRKLATYRQQTCN